MRLLRARAPRAFEVRHEHQRAHTFAPRLVFLPLRRTDVYALVDSRCRSVLDLGRFRLHQMDGLPGHDGRDRMLIHELRVTVAAQEHTKVVEPAHDPLELHAVDQKDSKRRLVLAYVVQERVLKILDSVCTHFFYPPVLGLSGDGRSRSERALQA